MATHFVTSNDLNSALESIFEGAQEQLILISPYIKLHDRYLSVLKTKKDFHGLKIVIVFGKNEDDISRSMQCEDFDFLKEFPNIEIRYEKRLHAKYYANESRALLTSMNLYNYSQDNNIESGILVELFSLLKIGSGFELEAAGYFDRVIEQADLLLKKSPQYESANFGFSKRYISSIVEKDTLSDFFQQRKQSALSKNNSTTGWKKNEPIKKVTNGYCIRTGVEIPFNPNQPMCNSAYQSWVKFGNQDYPEKYCHFSGEYSNGETTFSKPILKKNWSKAKEVHKIY